MSAALLDIQNLNVAFAGPRPSPLSRRVEVKAVDDVTLSVGRGETVGIVGESGAGKTTLLRAIVGLTHVSSGTIRYDGADVSNMGRIARKDFLRHVHLIFQNPYSAFHPRMTIGQSLREPLAIHAIGSADERTERIDSALRQVGLDPSFVTRYPHQFSGGQRQRLVLARALVLRAEVLLADEPVSALDVSIQAQVLNLLQELKSQLNLTYVVVAHDLAVMRYLCDRVAVMLNGRFVEIGRSEDVYARPGHAYTQALLDSVPTIRRGLAGHQLRAEARLFDPGGVLNEVEPGHFVVHRAT